MTLGRIGRRLQTQRSSTTRRADSTSGLGRCLDFSFIDKFDRERETMQVDNGGIELDFGPHGRIAIVDDLGVEQATISEHDRTTYPGLAGWELVGRERSAREPFPFQGGSPGAAGSLSTAITVRRALAQSGTSGCRRTPTTPSHRKQ